MLVVSPLRISNHHETKEEEEEEMECNFPIETGEDFLDCIDFDEIFVDEDGDPMPGLDSLAEFPFMSSDEMDYIWMSVGEVEENSNTREEENHKGTTTTTATATATNVTPTTTTSTNNIDDGGEKKPATTTMQDSKDLQGNKRKMKVDWTPELHRRFVQAVEQIGLDKAVPSRILEFMGSDCLTRHNVASHLQKYRKHLHAREAKRSSQIINYRVADHNPPPHLHNNQLGVLLNERDSKSSYANWFSPSSTMGFPPPNALHGTFKMPLHVWGHPSSNHSFHIWSPNKNLHSPPPWAPPRPPLQPPHSPYWHQHHRLVPHNALLAARTMGFPQTPRTMSFPSTLPSPVCRADHQGQHPLFDSHPTKECIDEAIGDVLSKPWLPLPLGLKPPSTESVLGELQHQGLSNILNSTTTCSAC
ncbi:hypothetical protein Syun_008555 [Stephania yunnanensis]|uniref:HTH myb-type domain-containing protein n=1 Tax=Stephania yunnanensis TaxID=152371 RepID=A0AAP0KCT5_9MAGN